MPFISDAQLERVQSGMASTMARANRAREAVAKQAHNMKKAGEIVGGAAAIAFVRGKYEKDGSSFVIPGTTIDGQLALGIAAVAGSLFNVAGKYDEDLLNVGCGVLAGYAQDVFRQYGKTDSIAMVAGRPMIGASHLGHQFGHPQSMNDSLRSALSASA
jgi:hypothetical protein